MEFSPVPVGVRLGIGHEENVDPSGERLDCFFVDPLLKRGLLIVDLRNMYIYIYTYIHMCVSYSRVFFGCDENFT